MLSFGFPLGGSATSAIQASQFTGVSGGSPARTTVELNTARHSYAAFQDQTAYGCLDIRRTLYMIQDMTNPDPRRDYPPISLDSCLHAPSAISVRQLEADTWLLIDPRMPNWVAVNRVGKEIVELCDGRRSVEAATETLCAMHHADTGSSKSNVLQFASRLLREQFLSLEPFSYAELDKSTMLGSDFVLWINVTHDCNLQCLHCFRSAGEAMRSELTTMEILDLVDQAAEMGCQEVVISGGEPLLRDDVLTIMQYIKRKRIPSLKLLTNGTLVTRRIARALKEMEPVYVQVSIDGATEAVADRIRGDGTFHKAITGVTLLAEAGLVQQLVIAMTLSRSNVHEVERFVELASDLGATGVHFPVFQAAGRGKINRAELEMDAECTYRALKTILRLKEESPSGINLSFSPNIAKYVRGLRRDYCGAGLSLWNVDPEGSVTPCAGLTDPQFVAGNIRDCKLEVLVRESDVAKRFQSLRLEDNSNCSSCELRFMCGGGCHVDRFNESGRLEGKTPKCEAMRRIYYDLFKLLIRQGVTSGERR